VPLIEALVSDERGEHTITVHGLIPLRGRRDHGQGGRLRGRRRTEEEGTEEEEGEEGAHGGPLTAWPLGSSNVDAQETNGGTHAMEGILARVI